MTKTTPCRFSLEPTDELVHLQLSPRWSLAPAAGLGVQLRWPLPDKAQISASLEGMRRTWLRRWMP